MGLTSVDFPVPWYMPHSITSGRPSLVDILVLDDFPALAQLISGLEVIKLEYNLKLKIKCNDWLLVDTCPQAADHCALF